MSYVPPAWKQADVLPLPKTAQVTSLSKDLRPISLTPVLSKVLESFVVAWMKESVTHCESQFGAIKGSSTTLALIKLIHQVLQGLEGKQTYARILLVDFSKAFDHIDHRILLEKLKANGMPPLLTAWQQNFLTGRTQRVKLGKTTSQWLGITGGVPQGTLSGPEDFLNMLDDLKTSVDDVKYMDDATLVEICSDGEESQLQSAASEIEQWASSNNMKLNSKKTKELLIHFGNNPPKVPPIIVNEEPIERVSSTKLLGCIINDKLSWENHISDTVNKASQRLHLLRELKRAGLCPAQLCTAYVSLVRSKAEYACQVWSTSLTEEQSDQLEAIQRRALKIISPTLPYADALKQHHLQPLKQRREELCYRLFKQMQDPSHKLNKLLPKPTVHRHNLRHVKDYPLPLVRTQRFKMFFTNWCLFNCQ